MEDREDLICAYRLDGKGGGRRLDWDGVRESGPQAGTLWVHLQREAPGSREWLETESGIDPILCEALLSDESRPRCEAYEDGLLLSLRGVNLNPGADTEDMIALLMWVEARRIITVRRRKIMAVEATRRSIEAERGPVTSGDFIARIADGLVERMGPVIADLDDQIDSLEESIVEGQTQDMRFKLAELRRVAIALRRYIAPQREAMARLHMQQAEWLSDLDRRRIREVTDRITRYVEDLDSARERASVIQEEMTTQLAEKTNKTIYVLTIFSAILLPAALLTGLFGINVGGMPWVKSEVGFWIVLGGVPALAFAVIAGLRLTRMI